jgi:outer membrane murein-binding lipoprotein Lpp
MIKELNSLLQKVNKVSKKVSDLNAVNELLNGNTKPAKRKLNNKIKNKIWNKL